MRKLAYSVIAALAVLHALPAMAADVSGAGNLGLLPDAAWATPLDEEDLGEMRGGYMGIAFSIWMQGSIEDLTGTMGDGGVTVVEPTTAVPPDLTFTSLDGDVQLGTVISDNFQGASGIFQIVSVPGSNVSVTNILNIQVTVVNVVDTVSITSMQDLFGF